MKDKLRIMAERPLNAETPAEHLRSWITPNAVFFARNQGAIPPRRIPLARWSLTVDGRVEEPRTFTFEQIRRMPRAIAADTLECSGNGRALLTETAAGNPWTIGGVGNAVWAGVWLKDVLAPCRPGSGGRTRRLRRVRPTARLGGGEVHPQHPARQSARLDPAGLRDERRAAAARARLPAARAGAGLDRRQLREVVEPHHAPGSPVRGVFHGQRLPGVPEGPGLPHAAKS